MDLEAQTYTLREIVMEVDGIAPGKTGVPQAEEDT